MRTHAPVIYRRSPRRWYVLCPIESGGCGYDGSEWDLIYGKEWLAEAAAEAHVFYAERIDRIEQKKRARTAARRTR